MRCCHVTSGRPGNEAVSDPLWLESSFWESLQKLFRGPPNIFIRNRHLSTGCAYAHQLLRLGDRRNPGNGSLVAESCTSASNRIEIFLVGQRCSFSIVGAPED